MSISRREFVKLMGLASAAGLIPGCTLATRKMPSDPMSISACTA